MISICIPIYNFNVTNLVKKLSALCQSLDAPSEIVLIDDCSHSYYSKLNEDVCKKEVYVQLEKNIGRATIRNLFLNHTKYEYLLFLDCDSIIYHDDFLATYVKELNQCSYDLICGGRIYNDIPPKRNELLRWKYGIYRESKPANVRNSNPNKSFMTNNFIVKRCILDAIKFEERLLNYGHEDTLFGYELKKNNIKITHIENPVLNNDLRDNVNYISDTEKAISNLKQILEYTDYDKEFISDVALLKTYYKIYGIKSLINGIFTLLKPSIKYVLSRGYVNLYLFDFYKLGTLSKIMNNKN
ncbi:MAG: glycosyltransferase family 2 protein [Flavobacteriaceae bacterium]|nr:glycosyltransferase family 2 protein [Flavobacteriaceae bacterium]